MALFSTFLLSNIDSSLLFNYRFPTLVVAHSLKKDMQTEQLLCWSGYDRHTAQTSGSNKEVIKRCTLKYATV